MECEASPPNKDGMGMPGPGMGRSLVPGQKGPILMGLGQDSIQPLVTSLPPSWP